MKYPLPAAAYSFNATAKTVTFDGTVPADISNIMHIANITRGVIYFQPQAGISFSGAYSSPTLTLNADTTGHSSSDKLLIVYDDGTASLTNSELRASPVGVAGTVAVTDNNSSLTVDSRAYSVAVTVLRPSNATAYAVGDVIGDTSGSAIIALSGIAPSGGCVLLQSAALVFSDSVVPAGMSAFRIHFYTNSPTAIADNAAYDLVSGDRAYYNGYVDLPAPQDLGSSLYTQTDYIGRLVKVSAGSTSLFALIETRGAYTPVSGSNISIRIRSIEASL